MSFLEKLADQRKKFLEGLDANAGDINLDIFEDFYPDQAHFVFELLQNAEDVGATEAAFTLTQDGCSFEHEGRPFMEPNVRAITGIHNTTKNKANDQIGKFGVGFKSVFPYTLRPTIHSGDFSFKISRLVLPEPVERDSAIGSKTRFWLPFNSSKKTAEEAYVEIASALGALAETTLLFLSHIKSISWQVGTTATGKVLSVQHSDHHFEVLKQTGSKTTTSSHFLKFDEPVEGLNTQRVAVAFALDFLPNVQQFDSKKPLARQLKIIPATPGRVAVSFPAAKEASGLRFHLHAPFVPELSRASIKETPANEPLFQQLARLTAASLHQIRNEGLLTAEFLAVVPNPQDSVADRYEVIRSAIVEEMNNQPLTPTHAKSYAPAKCLLQAKASLKELLLQEDIEFLVDYDEEPPQWAIGAAQKYSNADRFLAGLAIAEWDIDEFVKLLREKTTESSWRHPDDEFMAWLSGKPVGWHQHLYSLLHAEVGPDAGDWRFKDLRLVRLDDGNYSVGSKCFFPSNGVEHDEILPHVDAHVYTSGKSKIQQENARKFLEEIGVREVGEEEQIEAILNQRYTSANVKPKKRDLKRFIALVEKDPSKAELFAEFFIFEGNDGKWHRSNGVFLDQPFMDTDLRVYYDALGTNAKRVALAESYQNCGVPVKTLVDFAEIVGAQTRLEITRTNCDANPQRSYLRSVYGERSTSPIDRDYVITGLENLLMTPSLAVSKLVWQAMSSPPGFSDYLKATYQKNARWGAHQADSQLVHHLRKAAWVPQTNGQFVPPAEASRGSLPEGFPFDPGWQWLKAISFGEEFDKKSEEQRQKQTDAKKLGFADNESLERAKKFAALPLEEQERFLADQERRETQELPDHEPANPGRRAERVAAQAVDAPERRTEDRTRSVSIGLEVVKQEAAMYLRQQYTNDGEMFCQACKAPLPFKLDDGSDYFEKVEFLRDLKKRHYQNYLALCPNHAAMFQHANASTELMRESFVDLAGNELDVVLAQKDTTIYFTKTHIADLKAVMETDAADHFDHHTEPDQGATTLS